MKKALCGLLIMPFVLILPFVSHAQMPSEEFDQNITIKPTVGFEIFRRKIDAFTYNSEEEKWEKDEVSSLITSSCLTLGAELGFRAGFSLAAFVGYSFASYDPITYRRLPFSVEVEAKQTKGLVTGAEIKKSLFHVGNIEVGGFGQLIYRRGREKSWDIPGLNVDGKISGKSWWMSVSVGPIMTLRRSDSFHPYASLSYNRLWGKFNITETVLDVKGTEEKKIKGKSVMDIALGASYDITESFGVKAEIDLSPYSGGVDVGFLIRLMYSL